MKTLKIFIGIILISFLSCKNKTANPALASIELQRGELLLCGSGEFGEVSFSLSCNYSVRETFDLAVSLLHSFEYAEAEKAFVQVIDADPDCAMAYWGVAMSVYHALWKAPTPTELEKGMKILKITASLSKTEKEQDYLETIGAYYEDWQNIDHKTRAL